MMLGRPIYHESGQLLLAENMMLTQRLISRLQEHGVTVLYIQDKFTSDLELTDTIPLELRVKAIDTIKTTFNNLQNPKGKLHDIIKIDRFKDVISSIVKEIKASKRVVNLLSDMQVKDHYLFSHSLNVMIYTLGLAVDKGFNDRKLNEIGLGCILHDIGKMLIPENVLQKPGKLTDEEFEQIKKHTEFGFQMLRKEIEIPLLAAHCAFQHHEKWNGTGYPRGLKEEEIHPYARLIAVGDVFDALTSHRVYRKAMLPHEAIDIIFAETNTHFEQEAVEIFRKKIVIYPIGLTVELSTGEKGVVVDSNANFVTRPVIRVFESPTGEKLTECQEIDLSKNLSIMIVGCEAIL